MKKLTALVLSLVLIFSLSTTASAAEQYTSQVFDFDDGREVTFSAVAAEWHETFTTTVELLDDRVEWSDPHRWVYTVQPGSKVELGGDKDNATYFYAFHKDGDTYVQLGYVRGWGTITVDGLFGYFDGWSESVDVLGIDSAYGVSWDEYGNTIQDVQFDYIVWGGDPFEAPGEEKDTTAYASTQTVSIDGKAVELQAYALKDANGNPTNYVKLRDVAYALNGTAAQFEVAWDGNVNIVTGQSYTANGSEMSTPFSGDRPYTIPTAVTKINGEAKDLAAISLTDDNGGGYTYYQLRDLGRALGFNVGWSSERGIFIETDQPYTDAD